MAGNGLRQAVKAAQQQQHSGSCTPCTQPTHPAPQACYVCNSVHTRANSGTRALLPPASRGMA
jgi:hypothetical protein